MAKAAVQAVAVAWDERPGPIEEDARTDAIIASDQDRYNRLGRGYQHSARQRQAEAHPQETRPCLTPRLDLSNAVTSRKPPRPSRRLFVTTLAGKPQIQTAS